MKKNLFPATAYMAFRRKLAQHQPLKNTNMKRFFLSLAICLSLTTILSACSKKDGANPGEDGGGGNTPRSKVPAELVGGYWQAGSFSMSHYSNYDGSYAGQAFEIATGYKFLNDKGDAEEYFYYTNTGYYCRDQILGYRKGTVKFDEEAKTFEFFAVSGNYRRYDACGTSQSAGYGVKKIYGEDDLYPKYKARHDNYSIVRENGKTIWRISYDDGSTLEYTSREEPK